MNRCRVLLALALLAPALSAQVANSDPAVAKAAKDQIVTLDEFSVTSNDDQGYVASETLSGPRVKTKIAELPYTVETLTSEYFDDFAIFSLDDTLTQIGGFTGLSTAGSFTLRGFSNSYQLRDGFYRIGRYGPSNIDRIEVIKGPNAAVYGRTDPGGMVNMISKQPRPDFGAKLTFNYGSYDTQRQTLETTGTLLDTPSGQTQYLFTFSQFTRKYDVDYAENRRWELMGTLKHKFKDGGVLTFTAEYFMQYQHGLQQEYGAAAPLVTVKTAAGTTAAGYDADLAEHYDAFGPHSEFNRDNRSFTETYNKRLSDVVSVSLGSNLYRDHSWQENNNTSFGTIAVDTTNPNAAITTTRGIPSKQYYSEDGGAIQADVVADTHIFNGTVGTRTLATADLTDYYRWDPNYSIGTAANNPTVAAWNAGAAKTALAPVGGAITNLMPVNGVGYYPVNWSWNNAVVNSAHHNRQTVAGSLVSQRFGFFQDTLYLYAGTRYDIFRYDGHDLKAGTSTQRTFKEWKPNVGVNWQFIKGLYAYANYSTSWTANQGDQVAAVVDPTYRPETAQGWDYGIKGTLLGDRLTWTLTGFYANRYNVSVNELVETPPGSGNYVVTALRDGDQLVRGYEWDFNYHINQDLNLNGSWGHVYSIYTDYGADAPLAVGRRAQNVAPENGGISLRWGPHQGWLKGFAANVGWTYVRRTPTEAPNAGDTYSKPDSTGHVTLTSTTRQWALTVPSISLWNAGIHYTIRDSAKIGQRIGLNVNNAFDRIYLRASKAPGDRRAIYATYELGFGSYRP